MLRTDGFPAQGHLTGPEAGFDVIRASFGTETLPPEEDAPSSFGDFLVDIADHAIRNTPPANRDHEVFRLRRDPDTYEVNVESDITLEDYRGITHPDDWGLLMDWAKPLEGKKVVFINPTMEGGGVAMMRPPVVHLMKLLGIDAHWYVMEHTKDPDPANNPFLFTKLIHNISQRITGERITEGGKATHWGWADGENGPVLARQETIQNADFLCIDDPQPAPLIRRLKGVNPSAKIVWRNHIDTDNELMADPTTPQGEVASYLMNECGIADVDAAITHPVDSFPHQELAGVTYYSPATFDPHDNLNRHLNEQEIIEGIKFINSEIAEKNRELAAAGRHEDIQPLLSLDPGTQRVSLIARFDPSKGMDKAMEMGVLTRQKLRAQGVPEDQLPEIVIVGNGSIDDTDGVPMYKEILRIRREQYPEEAHGIIVMRLKHNYDAMNALMSRSTIIMQTSYAEGLETRVSDGIKHGKPVVVSNSGGIDTQVVPGKSGMVLDYKQPDYDLNRGADFMANLLTDTTAYKAMVATTIEQAETMNRREFTTTANVTRFFRIFNDLMVGRKANRTWRMHELVAMNEAVKLEAEEITA